MAARSLGWLLLPLTATGVALWQRLLWVSAISDDGLTFANASAWAAGRTPYRDFLLATPPGAVGLYAALFKATGVAYPPARLLTAMSVLLTVAALWDTARRCVPSAAAAVAATLYGTWTATFLFYKPHHFWSVTLPVVMAWALMRARESRRRVTWAAGAGLAAGLGVVVVQTAAAPLLAGLVAAVVFLDVAATGAFVAAAAAVGPLTLVWMLAAGLPGDFWRETIVYPATTFRTLNPVQVPLLPVQLADLGPPVYRALPLEKLVVWLAGFLTSLGVCVAALVVLARFRRSGSALGILILGAAGLDLSVLLARPTGPFLWMAAAVNLVLLAAAIIWLQTPRWLAAGLAAAALVLSATPLVQAVSDGCGLGSSGFRQEVSAAGGSVCVEAGEAGSLRPAVAFGRLHAREGVVYLAIITPAYTLAGSTPPVGYAWVAPDDLTTIDLERLEAQLGSRSVAWIISAPRIESAGFHSNSTQRAPDGRWTLDVYVDQHFDAVGRCGDWTLYHARGLPAASAQPCVAGTATASR